MTDKPLKEQTPQQRFEAFRNTLTKAYQHSTRIHVTYNHGHAGYFVCPCRVDVLQDMVRINGDKHATEIPLHDVIEFEFIDHEPIKPGEKQDAKSR
jgi:hypothetical protein